MCQDWISGTCKTSYHQPDRKFPGKLKIDFSWTLEDLLEGRKNAKVYGEFFHYFLPCIGRKTYWKHIIMEAKTDRDVSTVSNEAFALLLLENQWDCWVNLYLESNGVVTSKKGQKRSYSNGTVVPKYTRGGVTYTNPSSNEKVQTEEIQRGWSKNGIKRFNELFHIVKKDRKENPLFIEQWLREEKIRLGDTYKKALKKSEEVPMAENELYSDSGEEDEIVADKVGSGGETMKKEDNSVYEKEMVRLGESSSEEDQQVIEEL